jgi:hypothetical protein
MRSEHVMTDPEYTDRLIAALDATTTLREDQRELFQTCDSIREVTMRLASELEWYRSATQDSVRRLHRTRSALSDRLRAQRQPWR